MCIRDSRYRVRAWFVMMIESMSIIESSCCAHVLFESVRMVLRIELVYYQVLAEFSPTTPQTKDNRPIKVDFPAQIGNGTKHFETSYPLHDIELQGYKYDLLEIIHPF